MRDDFWRAGGTPHEEREIAARVAPTVLQQDQPVMHAPTGALEGESLVNTEEPALVLLTPQKRRHVERVVQIELWLGARLHHDVASTAGWFPGDIHRDCRWQCEPR